MKIYGPKLFIRMKNSNVTIDIFGDIHRKLDKNTFDAFIKKQYINYDKICLEAHKININNADKLSNYNDGLVKHKDYLLNKTNLTLLNLIIKQKIEKNNVIYFDNRSEDGYPLPKGNSINEWKIYLKKSKLNILDKIINKNNTINIKKAYAILSDLALAEVRNMDISLVKKLNKSQKIKRILIVCGVEHVLDFMCILTKLKFTFEYINDEYSKYYKKLNNEINKYDYLKERNKFSFDKIIATNDKQYITIT